MLFNQFIANCGCSMSFSRSNVSPKIKSPTMFFVCLEVFHIKLTKFEQFLWIFKINQSFRSEAWSDLWFCKKLFNFFHFVFPEGFDLCWFLLPFFFGRFPKLAVTEFFSCSIYLKIHFPSSESGVLAEFTLPNRRVILCWHVLVLQCLAFCQYFSHWFHSFGG